MSDQPADRDGMFYIRVLEDGSTVAICRRCGAKVVDILDAAHVCDPASAEDPPWQDY